MSRAASPRRLLLRRGALVLGLALSACEPKVTETPMEVVRVDVTAPRTSLTVNETVQLSATPRNEDGDGMTARGVSWSSSNATVAQVSASGLVTARAAGSARITATSGSASGGVDLTIIQPPSISLSAAAVALNGVAGSASAVTSSVNVSNGGGGVLSGLAAAVQHVTGSGWLQATLSGTSPPAQVQLQASAQSLAPGTYQAVVTVSSPVAPSSSLNVTFAVVEPPSFQLAVAPAALSLQAGASGSVTVSVTRRGGFTGAVTVTPQNLPTGVTAAPVVVAAGATSGTLTLNAAANAAAGTSTLTLRGSGSGVTDQTATLALTITDPPGYTLSVTPATVSVTQGTTTQATVSVARAGGFGGVVNLSASGQPAGLTLSFNPAAAAGTQSLLTITAAGTVATGTYPVTIRGTATGLPDRTITLNVQVGSGVLVVTTNPADSITMNAARLLGSVANNGTTYTVWFEWSTSSTFSPYTPMASGSGPGSTCATSPVCNWRDLLTGLQPNTTYYFRIVAQNAAGVSRGQVRSFRTLAPPTAPVISNATYTLQMNSASCSATHPHLLRLSFAFTDVNGDVAFTGTPITQTWLGQPSGATSTDALAVDSFIGNGATGTINVPPFCWTFGSDTNLRVTLSLRDAAGLVSNALIVNVPIPQGGPPEGAAAVSGPAGMSRPRK